MTIVLLVPGSPRTASLLASYDRHDARPEQGRDIAAARRMTRMLVLYHYTSAEAAEEILREGFQDGEGLYLTTALWRGVWLSDNPLDSNDTGRLHRRPAWVRVSLDLPEEAIAEYEWVCEEGSYREWLIPAALINAHATLAPYDKWADEDDLPTAGKGSIQGSG